MNLLIVFFSLMIQVFISIGSVKASEVKTTGEVVSLKEFEVQAGKHCESAAMMNALNYQGLSLSESMINGLGSSISFIVVDGKLPFLGCRVDNLRENFEKAAQIQVVEVKPVDSQVAYDLVKAKLQEKIPIVLQVNMRYLPYRYGGKFGHKYTSFAGHFVTLIKLDEQEGYAWVSDTQYEQPQKIKISHLMKARKTKGNYFAPEYTFYYFEINEKTTIDYKAGLKASLKSVITEYERESGALARLKDFSEEILKMEEKVSNQYILKPIFEFFYGSIETNGTGGSGFRNFYRDYLMESGKLLNSPEITDTAKFVDDAGQSWSIVANEFKKIAGVIDNYRNDPEKRKKLYENAFEKFKVLVQAEAKMLNRLKELNQMLN